MNIFLISDTHFGHEAPCSKFKRKDGSPLRAFSCAAECDQYMEEQWNKTVKPNDKIYHLGDISMSKKHLPILERLNGEKVLIRGNHDTEKASVYLKYFKDVRGSHQFDGLLLTHIPVHPESLARWGFNVHGHLHANIVSMMNFGPNSEYEPLIPDPRYFCVSVENIGYTPISLEQVKKHKPELELEARMSYN
jgi:calcineurin-like phosphoesterase family protein